VCSSRSESPDTAIPNALTYRTIKSSIKQHDNRSSNPVLSQAMLLHIAKGFLGTALSDGVLTVFAISSRYPNKLPLGFQ